MKEDKEERIRALVFSFDLPFSDIRDNDSVRSVTIKKKFKELDHIGKIKNGDSIINFALFMKLGEKHPSAQLWLETETDLSSSIYLMLGGYYRQALMCLRTWLELTLIGITTSIGEEKHQGTINGNLAKDNHQHGRISLRHYF